MEQIYDLLDLRHLGDLVHMIGALSLTCRLIYSRNSWGVSARTQDLCLIFFCLRYVDLLWNRADLFNVACKVIFLTCSVATCVWLRWAAPAKHDALEIVSMANVLLLASMAGFVGWAFADERTLFELSWRTSLSIEALAMFPQITLLPRLKSPIPSFFPDYLFLSGAYRVLYMVHWTLLRVRGVHRSPFEWICAAVQNALLVDVIWLYVRHKRAFGVLAPVHIAQPKGDETV